MVLTANELKKRGVKSIEERLKTSDDVVITVRGEVKYVVVAVEKYDEMRLAELNMAYLDAMEDIKNGNFTIESADEHVSRVWKEINGESTK